MNELAEKLDRWERMSKELKKLRDDEMELRKELSAAIIGSKEMKNGRVTERTIVNNRKVKTTQALTYRFDNGILEKIWDALTTEDHQAIRIVPELNLREYRKIEGESILHEAVVARLGAPIIEFED